MRRPSAASALLEAAGRADRRAREPGTVAAGYRAERLPLARSDARRRIPAAGSDRPRRATSGAGSRRWRSASRSERRAPGVPTLFLSGEMGPERVLERALRIEGRRPVDDLRQGRLDATARGVGRRGGAAAAGRSARCSGRCSDERFAEMRGGTGYGAAAGAGGGGLARSSRTAAAARGPSRGAGGAGGSRAQGVWRWSAMWRCW